MKKLKWSLLAAVAFVAALGLHWSLPSRDIVSVVNTEITRRDVNRSGADGQTVERSQNVRYIHAMTPAGEALVYRNEDTGFGWPPYFKFDSATLAAEAEGGQATDTSPNWMVITSYGWRVDMTTWFPNAVALRPATGPEEPLFPWFNIALLGALAVGALLVWTRIKRLFGRSDPAPASVRS